MAGAQSGAGSGRSARASASPACAHPGLAYIRGMLVPGLDPTRYDQAQEQRGRVASGEMVSGDDGVKAEEAVVAPPYVSEMSIAHKEDGWVFRFMSLFGAVRQPSKHEQLFGALGSNGPRLYMHYIKCVLLFAVVSVAALCVVLFEPLWTLNPVLPFVAVLPALVAIFLTPRMVILYVWCCSCEMLKDVEVVIQVTWFRE